MSRRRGMGWYKKLVPTCGRKWNIRIVASEPTLSPFDSRLHIVGQRVWGGMYAGPLLYSKKLLTVLASAIIIPSRILGGKKPELEKNN